MSQNSARKNYIQGEVFTATPQKLQLLLVEAAIKNVNKTKQFWLDSNFDGAFESLTKAQDIVAEILCCLDVENNPDIAKKFASIYVFIFKRLTEAGMKHDSAKLDDALRILTSERETWRLVCEKFGSTKTADNVPRPSANASGDVWAAATPVQTVDSSKTILGQKPPILPTGHPNPMAPPNSVKPIPGVPSHGTLAAKQSVGFSWDA